MEIIAQYPFDFLGALFELYETHPHNYYLPIKALCDTFGLDYQIEYQRIKANETLANHVIPLRVPILDEDENEQKIDLECLTLQHIPFWACTVDSNNAKKPFRKLIRTFKIEMARALWEVNFPRVSADDLGISIRDEKPYKPNQFSSYVHVAIQKPDQPPSIAEIRFFLYWGKIVDLCWFDGDLPINATTSFECYRNPKWPYQSSLPESVGGIWKLSEPELQLICRRLKKPSWADQRTKLGSMSLDKIPMDWTKWDAKE